MKNILFAIIYMVITLRCVANAQEVIRWKAEKFSGLEWAFVEGLYTFDEAQEVCRAAGNYSVPSRFPVDGEVLEYLYNSSPIVASRLKPSNVLSAETFDSNTFVWTQHDVAGTWVNFAPGLAENAMNLTQLLSATLDDYGSAIQACIELTKANSTLIPASELLGQLGYMNAVVALEEKKMYGGGRVSKEAETKIRQTALDAIDKSVADITRYANAPGCWGDIRKGLVDLKSTLELCDTTLGLLSRPRFYARDLTTGGYSFNRVAADRNKQKLNVICVRRTN